ncbi:TolC family protein [Aliiglaciecola sp. LCG003]|uniref:efflux transporter outer membrane subunit n=1 Tax=Aliiglaciecola sp. LCG003 TaxID=3053655 RepID=UPI002573829A|nr:TolC family protein [Aliiglaciecola sp. LCG003]WJG08818.1 TolC family protein [Aliiglaciecola sp. LCG003]
MGHKSLRILPAIASALILSGCVQVIDAYQAPLELRVNQVQIKSAAGTSLSQRDNHWWQHFDDQGLNALIVITLQNNPSLAIAQANIEAAYAMFADADNDDLPKGEIGATYTVSDQVVIGGSQARLNSRSYRAGSDLRWSLDLFNKLEFARQVAEADVQVQTYAWQQVRVNLAAQVATLYGEWNGLQTQIEVAKRNLGSLGKTQQVIDARQDAGFVSELDGLRIEAQLLGVKARIPALTAQSIRIENSIKTLAGLPPQDDSLSIFQPRQFYSSDITPLEHLVLTRPVAIGVTANLLNQRPDVLLAERQLAAANAQLGFQTASLYPDISVSGFVGFLSGDLAYLGNQTKAWSIAPSISWSALDFSSMLAQVDIADAQLTSAKHQFHKVVLDALNEAQTALSVYTQSQLRLNLLRQQVVASEGAQHIAQLQYDAGTIDLLVLLDAERIVLQAKDNLAQTQAQVFAQIVEIYRAFGGGLIAQSIPPDEFEQSNAEISKL